ncbi:MAG: ABC transporter substrate-binding protein [Burkholderiales bacterium]|nr:ABC transporter substrate-binding protein [Burkholderiales bacterium]
MRRTIAVLYWSLAAVWVMADIPRQPNAVVLGSSAALTGPAAELGLRFHFGARAYFDEINKTHALRNQSIYSELMDDGYEPTKAQLNTRKLLGPKEVVALFGYVGTPTSYAALPLVNQAQIPFVGAFTGAQSLRVPVNPYVFNIRASYDDEAKVIAKSLQHRGAHKLNVLYQYDAFGEAGLSAMRRAIEGTGVEIGSTASVPRNIRNVARAVDELVRKQPADAIYMVSTYATCASFIRSARMAGFKGRFYALSFTGLEPLRSSLGGEMSGVSVSQVVPDPSKSSLPLVGDYKRAMAKEGANAVDAVSLEGYIVARVLVEALKHAPPHPTRADMLKALDTLGDLDLGGFHLHFSPNDHEASHWVELLDE